MKSIKFLLFIILFNGIVFSQTSKSAGYGSVIGLVIDGKEQNPLQFANIVLFNSSDSSQFTGTVSNQSGVFKMEKIVPAKYYIRISSIGYQQVFIDNINIKQNNVIDLGKIKIFPQAYDVKEVVVEAERAPISYEIDKKVINVSEQITSRSGTAVDVLENVPSVTVDIEGNVSLRGNSNFTVQIDGRPSILEPADALNQIPASAIENIEIITNPSAKYDPEGSAGIINIILKKNRNNGISGVLSLNGGLGEKYGAEALVDYKTEDFSTNLDVDYNSRIFDATTTERNWSISNGATSYINSDGHANWGREGYGLKGSIAYDLSANNLFTIGARYRDRNMNRNSNLLYHEWIDNNLNENFYNSNSYHKRGGTSISAFTNFLHRFEGKGHELTFDFSYDRDNGDESSINELLNNGIVTEGSKSTEIGPENEYRIKLDYTLPLGEDNKFEAGTQADLENSVEKTSLYDLISGNYIEDLSYHNETSYRKNIYSMYSMYSNKINDFGFQFGLRGEYTDRQIGVLSEPNDFIIDRFDFFPSAHFSYEIAQNHQIMTSYTRRIQRPRGWELEPFETRVDAYNVRKGNPGLQPEYINSMELSYQTLIGKSIISIETYYRITHNRIERIRSVYDQNVTLQTTENVGQDYSLGTELFINFDPITNWNVNLMGNLFDYRIEGQLANQDFSRRSFNWNLRFNNSIKISANTQFQFNVIYNSPSVTSQGNVASSVYTNFAAKQDFFNKMLTATLQVRDIFGTAKREFTYESSTFRNYGYYDRESPIVMLNLRFNINNYKSEEKRGNEGDGMDSSGEF